MKETIEIVTQVLIIVILCGWILFALFHYRSFRAERKEARASRDRIRERIEKRHRDSDPTTWTTLHKGDLVKFSPMGGIYVEFVVKKPCTPPPPDKEGSDPTPHLWLESLDGGTTIVVDWAEIESSPSRLQLVHSAVTGEKDKDEEKDPDPEDPFNIN